MRVFNPASGTRRAAGPGDRDPHQRGRAPLHRGLDPRAPALARSDHRALHLPAPGDRAPRGPHPAHRAARRRGGAGIAHPLRDLARDRPCRPPVASGGTRAAARRRGARDRRLPVHAGCAGRVHEHAGGPGAPAARPRRRTRRDPGLPRLAARRRLRLPRPPALRHHGRPGHRRAPCDGGARLRPRHPARGRAFGLREPGAAGVHARHPAAAPRRRPAAAHRQDQRPFHRASPDAHGLHRRQEAGCGRAAGGRGALSGALHLEGVRRPRGQNPHPAPEAALDPGGCGGPEGCPRLQGDQHDLQLDAEGGALPQLGAGNRQGRQNGADLVPHHGGAGDPPGGPAPPRRVVHGHHPAREVLRQGAQGDRERVRQPARRRSPELSSGDGRRRAGPAPLLPAGAPRAAGRRHRRRAQAARAGAHPRLDRPGGRRAGTGQAAGRGASARPPLRRRLRRGLPGHRRPRSGRPRHPAARGDVRRRAQPVHRALQPEGKRRGAGRPGDRASPLPARTPSGPVALHAHPRERGAARDRRKPGPAPGIRSARRRRPHLRRADLRQVSPRSPGGRPGPCGRHSGGERGRRHQRPAQRPGCPPRAWGGGRWRCCGPTPATPSSSARCRAGTPSSTPSSTIPASRGCSSTCSRPASIRGNQRGIAGRPAWKPCAESCSAPWATSTC